MGLLPQAVASHYTILYSNCIALSLCYIPQAVRFPRWGVRRSAFGVRHRTRAPLPPPQADMQANTHTPRAADVKSISIKYK